LKNGVDGVQRRIPLVGFIAAFTIFTMLAFQRPLLGYAIPFLNLHEFQGLVQFASLQMLQFLLMVIALGMLAFLPMSVLKGFCIVTLFVNAAAAYFMTTYNAEVDRTMIANILNTDQREMVQIWHPKLLAQILFLAVLPSILILRVKIIKPRWYAQMGVVILAFAALISWAYATAFTWLWFDKHASRLGGRVLPWAYIVNTARYFDQAALAARDQVLLPDATFLAPVPEGQKDIVVLVIGEASRAQDYAYYGYARDTNPFTQGTGLVALPAGQSCATYTIGSVACILTHEGSAASARTEFEPLNSYLTRFGVQTIFRTNNFGEPPIKVDEYKRAFEVVAACKGDDCPEAEYDEALVWGLTQELTASTASRIFVTLHEAGSHGPSYWRKYPPEFEEFKPGCDTVEVASCSHESLVNAYDNTVRYTDYVNAKLIDALKGVQNARVAMIYVSDHGQSLGENGLYLHGAPIAVAPQTQRLVPFLVWMSDSFQAAHGVTPQSIQREETKPHDFPFHSIMGALGMRSAIYKPEFDIFAKPTSK
jgi:lipid A ethanolaminephosphotransferase